MMAATRRPASRALASNLKKLDRPVRLVVQVPSRASWRRASSLAPTPLVRPTTLTATSAPTSWTKTRNGPPKRLKNSTWPSCPLPSRWLWVAATLAGTVARRKCLRFPTSPGGPLSSRLPTTPSHQAVRGVPVKPQISRPVAHLYEGRLQGELTPWTLALFLLLNKHTCQVWHKQNLSPFMVNYIFLFSLSTGNTKIKYRGKNKKRDGKNALTTCSVWWPILTRHSVCL